MPFVSIERLQRLLIELESYCEEGQLVQIQYRSSSEKPSQIITFLPQKVFNNHCNLYVLGHSADKEKASMLRLDKIEHLLTIENPELLRALQSRQIQQDVFIIRLLYCSQKQYEPLGDNDELVPDPGNENHLLAMIQTSNEFLLKQKLLSSGYQFQILYPERFKQEMEVMLNGMRELYI